MNLRNLSTTQIMRLNDLCAAIRAAHFVGISPEVMHAEIELALRPAGALRHPDALPDDPETSGKQA